MDYASMLCIARWTLGRQPWRRKHGLEAEDLAADAWIATHDKPDAWVEMRASVPERMRGLTGGWSGLLATQNALSEYGGMTISRDASDYDWQGCAPEPNCDGARLAERITQACQSRPMAEAVLVRGEGIADAAGGTVAGVYATIAQIRDAMQSIGEPLSANELRDAEIRVAHEIGQRGRSVDNVRRAQAARQRTLARKRAARQS